MPSEERDPAYLWNALRAGRILRQFVTGLTLDEYLEDRMVQSAVERQLEIFGEAARKLSDAFREAHPEIPWRQIIGLRNILAHRYYDTDHVLLWKIIHGELTRVLEQIERFIP